ncbi:unnamed protein product, partial [Discosporangium mesarthrocarpum]
GGRGGGNSSRPLRRTSVIGVVREAGGAGQGQVEGEGKGCKNTRDVWLGGERLRRPRSMGAEAQHDTGRITGNVAAENTPLRFFLVREGQRFVPIGRGNRTVGGASHGE